jgi:ATP-dependent Clp protease ATP-binding subunit ClpC
MFERFTQRARHTVVLAQEEARLLHHNYIGTEHILLGLLGEPESVAGTVLASFGLTREGTRQEVEAAVGQGKKAPSGHIPFTPRAKKTLELSLREALALGHNYIGTEHILLGLIREGDGVAAQVLGQHGGLTEIRAAVLEAAPAAASAGEDADDEANAVLRWLRHRLGRRVVTSVPIAPGLPYADAPARGTPAVEAALAEAARLAGALPVGSHHLLLASIDDPHSAASSTLAGLGVDLDVLRTRLRDAQLTGTTDEPLEQAGRRQMAVEVSPELLRIVLTDPVIVSAGRRALRAVNASATAEGQPTEANRVIRGDLPGAAGLATVWQDLHETLLRLAETTPADPEDGSEDSPEEETA